MPPYPGQEEGMKRMVKIVNSLLARQDCAPFREPVDWRGLELYDYPQLIKKMMDLGTVKRKLERGHYSTVHQVAEDIRLVWSNCMTYNADGSDFWLLAKSFSRRFEDRYRKVKAEFDVGEYWDSDDEGHAATSTSKTSSSKGSKSSSTSGNAKDSSSLSQQQHGSSVSLTGGSGAPTRTSSSSSLNIVGGNGLGPNGMPSLDARARFGANLFYLSGNELGHVMTTLEIECPHVLEPWDQQKIEINVDEIPPKVFSSLQAYVADKVCTRHPTGNNLLSHLPGSPNDANGLFDDTATTATSSGKSRKKRKSN